MPRASPGPWQRGILSDGISALQAVSPSTDPAAQMGLMSLLPPSCPQELSAFSWAGHGLCHQPQLLPSAFPQVPKAPPELWFGAVPAARGSCLCEERHRVQGAHGFSPSVQGLVPTPSPCPPGTFPLTATFPVLRSDPHGLFPWWGPCPPLACLLVSELPRKILPLPVALLTRCLQLVPHARVPQMVWRTVGLSGGSLGTRVNKSHHCPLWSVPRATGWTHTGSWSMPCRERMAACPVVL